MYPTLYHAFHDLLGLDLQILKLLNTFGFFVALAFLAAARCLASELARRHAEGLIPSTRRRVEPPRATTVFDVLLSGAVAFVLGFKFFGVALGEHKLQGGADTQRYLLSSQGHLWAGLLCGVAWMAYRAQELRSSRAAAKAAASKATASKAAAEPEFVEVLPPDHTMGITGAAALGGLIGAKVFHWLERPRSILEFFENPSFDAITAGLTIYGGLIVGGLFVYGYCRRNKLPFAQICDANAPGVMLAYGIGRLGCQLSGDGDWGIPSVSEPPRVIAWLPSWLWSFDYPNNVIRQGVPMVEGGFPGYGTHLVPPVYPTPLYEVLAAVAIFGLLWYLRKRIRRPLMLFGIYLMLNGFERFWIEKIRVNATYDLFGVAVTQAEIIAVALFVAGAALVWTRLRAAPAAPLLTSKPTPE
jgi:prolipoprotein diacylglyceryltransferase